MSQFQILSDLEHVKKRIGMYAGSTAYEPHDRFLFGQYKTLKYVPAIVKIIEEILDNSIDEAIRTKFKYANQISVAFDGSIVEINDNGRGIPQHDVLTPEGKSIPQPVAAWTRAKAGSNFDDTNRVTMGMNGVGSMITNALSEWFVGETCDGSNIMTVNCTDGATNISWKVKPGTAKGTKVRFHPEFSYFETMMLDQTIQDIIHDRLITLSIVFPDIQFKFNGKKVKTKFKQYVNQFNDNSIIVEDTLYSLAFCTSPDGFRQVSYVNGLNIKNGGSHIDYVIDAIYDELAPGIKRKYKLEVTKARIKESLTMIMIVRDLPNLRFDSQTKERLTNPAGDIKRHVDFDVKKMARTILNNEGILMPIIETALARKLAAEKAAQTKAQKKAGSAKVAKHIKAGEYQNPMANTTLFLAEGDSAIGPLCKVRNTALHGGFPLRGKVLNTWGLPEAKILENKEIFEIMAITGLKFGETPNMNYRNIGILVDADTDGVGSIYPLLLAFFARWPELYEQQRIHFIKTPIIIATKGKEQEWFYDIADYEKKSAKFKNYEVRYIKGLGSLREHEYQKVINEPVYDIVQLPENYVDLFEMLFGDDANKRKAWMSE